MYITLADLAMASAGVLPEDTSGPQSVPGTGYEYNLVSDSSGSLINSGAYNPGKGITIISEIRIDDQSLVFQIPIENMMIPFKTLYDRYKTAEANFLRTGEHMLQMQSAQEGPVSGPTLKWAPGYPVNLGGALSFHGWAIAQEPHSPYAKFLNIAPEKTDNSGLQGDIELKLNGKVLGTLHYFWGNISYVERATSLNTEGRLGYGTDPDAINIANNVPNAPPVQRSITGDSGFKIPKDYRKTRFGDLWQFQDIFDDCYYNVKLNGGLTGAPATAVDCSFGYNPVMKQQITDYYNETSERNLLEMGYEDPASELMNRLNLRANFPQTTAEGEFCRFFNDHPKIVTSRISGFAPNDADYIFKVMSRQPKQGWLFFRRSNFNAILANLKAMHGGSIPVAVMDDFKDALRAVMEDVQNRELRIFDYTFFNYAAMGMMPSSVINFAAKEYNKRKEESAERAKSQGIITAIIGVALMAIPVVGTGFGLALGMAGAKSNYDQLMAQKKKQEASQKVFETGMKEIEETRRVERVEDPALKKNPFPVKTVAVVGGGLLAAALAFMD